MGTKGVPVIIQNQKHNHGKVNTGIVDPPTSSLTDIKLRVNFEIPQEVDTRYFRNNLLAQGTVHRSSLLSLLETQNLSEAQRNRLQQTPMPTEKNALAKVYRAGAISAPVFSQNTAFAEAFGDLLLHDNPGGIAEFAFLTTLKNEALRRHKKEKKKEKKHQASQSRRQDKPVIATDPCEKQSSEHSALTPLVIRQETWTALCPRRRCSDSGRRTDTGQRTEARLENYIHLHVRIDVTQRKLPDGRSAQVLLLGLVEHAYNLRFSRLGLLQVYDMVICWASRVDSDGVSVSLKSAFDGCNQITEDIVAGEDRIAELAGLEKRLERFMPDISQFDEAVERISQWMERHKHKLVSSPEDRERRLRNWCKKRDELGDMGNDLLEQACQQAVEAKTREWKKSKRRTERAGIDGDTDGARPTKRRRKG
ncbi:hypothetical protein LY78DRAFT_750414 [Colletotrichum sublineola]|nr:hypothetical protein LY78DRAFT_750414 [Colletotrichum sublineola]